jgi:plastocyanin
MIFGGAFCVGVLGLGVSGTASAATKSAHSSVTITIKNFAFTPSHITVKPGQKIKVVNKDGVTHTLTSLSNKFNTGNVSSGQTKTITAPKKAGRYPYRCNIHQFMTGVISVS